MIIIIIINRFVYCHKVLTSEALSSVCLSDPTWNLVCLQFAAVAWPAADVDGLLHGTQQWQMNAGSETLSAYIVSEHRLVIIGGLCK